MDSDSRPSITAWSETPNEWRANMGRAWVLYDEASFEVNRIHTQLDADAKLEFNPDGSDHLRVYSPEMTGSHKALKIRLDFLHYQLCEVSKNRAPTRPILTALNEWSNMVTDLRREMALCTTT